MPIDQLPNSVAAFAPDGRAKVQELVTAANDAADGTSTAFAEAMVAWLGTLPTSDPAVAGEPYLATGVLTVSAG